MQTLLLAALALGCGGPAPAKDSDEDTETTDTPDTGVSLVEETCPWAGAWELDYLLCGAFVTSAQYDRITLDIRHGAGGCELTLEIASPGCREVETMRIAPAWAAAPVELESDGVTECSPHHCTHDAAGDERACEVGDRAGSSRALVTADLSGLQIEGEWAHLYPACTSEMVLALRQQDQIEDDTGLVDSALGH